MLSTVHLVKAKKVHKGSCIVNDPTLTSRYTGPKYKNMNVKLRSLGYIW